MLEESKNKKLKGKAKEENNLVEIIELNQISESSSFFGGELLLPTEKISPQVIEQEIQTSKIEELRQKKRRIRLEGEKLIKELEDLEKKLERDDILEAYLESRSEDIKEYIEKVNTIAVGIVSTRNKEENGKVNYYWNKLKTKTYRFVSIIYENRGIRLVFKLSPIVGVYLVSTKIGDPRIGAGIGLTGSVFEVGAWFWESDSNQAKRKSFIKILEELKIKFPNSNLQEVVINDASSLLCEEERQVVAGATSREFSELEEEGRNLEQEAGINQEQQNLLEPDERVETENLNKSNFYEAYIEPFANYLTFWKITK